VNIKGQAAIVTGGGSGLGAATAARLAESGAKIAILDINLDAAREVAARTGGHAIKCDVSDEASAISALAEARGTNGGVRILRASST
jgi:NAD(P)-dependent dehydrogenase (short-subunit alcohol dehydrogenase family)